MTLTLTELRSLVNRGVVSPTEYSLSLASLNSPPVSALAKYLADGALAMGAVVVKQSDADGTVTVTGTASSGCFTGCAVTAVFGIAGGQATLSITANAPSGWGLATGFPVLADSPVDGLRFDAATFSVASTVSAGLATFAGTLAVSPFLEPLASLLGAGPPRLTGSVDVVTGMPSFVLSSQQARIDLGFTSPLTSTFEVHADPVTRTVPTETNPPGTTTVADVTASMMFRATLPFSVENRQYELPVVATVVDPTTHVRFTADLANFTDVIEAGLADLVELTAGISLGAPPTVAGLSVTDLMTLRDVTIQVNPSAQRKLVSVSLEVANGGTWTILPPDTPGGGLAVTGLLFRIDVDMATRQPTFAIMADIDVGLDAPLQLSAFAPEFTLIGGLRTGTSVPLRDVVTRFAPADVSGFPNLEVAGLMFAIQPGSAYSLDVDVSGDWPIPLGFTDLSITNLHLSVDYVRGTGLTGSLSGVFTIDGVDVALSAAHPGTGHWVFTATAAARTPVDLVSIVDGLLPDGIVLPAELSALRVRGLTASWDTGPGKHFSVGGETDVAVTVGPSSLTATTTVSIDSLLGAGGQRTTSGRLSGTVKLGTTAFTASYAFRPDTQTLTATWSGQNVDFTSLATAFDIPVPPLEVNLSDLGLRTASFELDWSRTGQDSVIINATTAFGTAFFAVARPRPLDGWGFVFGASLDGADRLSQLFSHAGLDITGLDFLKLDAAVFLVASTQFQRLQVAGFPVLGASPTTVNAGVSGGVLLNLGGSASRPDVNALRTLMGQATALYAEVTLSTSLTALAVTAKLAGGLVLKGAGADSLTLSDAALVLKVAPLALTVRGSMAVPVGQVTMLATGLLTVASNGSLTAAFHIEGENGQALPFPMGFPGVHLLDLGVLVGATLAPPSVQLGFQGRFVIGETDPRPTGQAVASRPLNGMPPPNEFVMIVGLTGQIPNPLLLSMYLQELSVGEAIEAFTGHPPAGLPDVLTEITASELMIYWCDAAQGIQQPDGTWAYPGFGFNGMLDLAGFNAYGALKITETGGISGDACLDPVHLPGVLDLTGTGTGTPLTRVGAHAVRPGGPFVHINTKASPYLAVNWDVVLFNAVTQTLDAQLTTTGFRFETAYKVGDVFSRNLTCSLRDWTHFELGFGMALRVDVPIGAVAGVDLGPIHLDTSFTGTVVVDVGDGFSMTTTGTFAAEGHHYTLPAITSSVPFASLDAIPAAVVDQIRRHANTIFQDVIDQANQIINDANAKAAQIRANIDMAALHMASFATEVFGQAQRDADAAEQSFQTALSGIEQVAAAGRAEASTIAEVAVRQATASLQNALNAGQQAVTTGTNAVKNAWRKFKGLF